MGQKYGSFHFNKYLVPSAFFCNQTSTIYIHSQRDFLNTFAKFNAMCKVKRFKTSQLCRVHQRNCFDTHANTVLISTPDFAEIEKRAEAEKAPSHCLYMDLDGKKTSHF